MPGFYTHLLLGGLISVFIVTLVQRELKTKYIYLGMISGLIPDIDILLGGFHGINMDTTILFFPLDFLTQITVRFNFSDYLDHGIINIEHRGITHSLEFFLIGMVILMLIVVVIFVFRRSEISRIVVIFSIIGLSWVSHIIADSQFLTAQANGFEIAMTFILWVKYHKQISAWTKRNKIPTAFRKPHIAPEIIDLK
jgi:membrane-bound metal-dependent hydrolase YbcI (DUF457 family)